MKEWAIDKEGIPNHNSSRCVASAFFFFFVNESFQFLWNQNKSTREYCFIELLFFVVVGGWGGCTQCIRLLFLFGLGKVVDRKPYLHF